MSAVPNVCELDVMGMIRLPRPMRDVLELRSTRISGISTVAELKCRITECLHWNTLNSRPLTNAYLNRLYGRVAYRVGTTSGAVLDELILNGDVRQFPYGARRAFVTARLWAEFEAATAPDELDACLEAWSANVR